MLVAGGILVAVVLVVVAVVLASESGMGKPVNAQTLDSGPYSVRFLAVRGAFMLCCAALCCAVLCCAVLCCDDAAHQAAALDTLAAGRLHARSACASQLKRRPRSGRSAAAVGV